MRYGKPRLQGRVGSIACLHSSCSCSTVRHPFRVSSSTPGRFKPVILTSLHDMEGSRSFMQLYKHKYQLHGMLSKNRLSMTARIEHTETAGGTRTRRPATLTGTRRTYDLRLSTKRDSAASQRRRHDREARARESREEGETRRRANADAMREARARESREGETRR